MLYGAMNSPLKPILEELESAADLGFDYLELAMDPPTAHYRQIFEKRHQILSALERHRLSLVCHLPTFVYLADLTDSIRQASVDEVLASLSEAAALHPLKIVLHPPYISGLGVHVPELARRYALESLAMIIERGQTLGQVICLENMPPSSGFCSGIDEIAGVMEQFPQIFLTLDIGHANISTTQSGEKRPWPVIFSKRLRHLHLSDNHGRSDEHLPIGSGNVNLSGLIRNLKKIKYDQTVTFEIFSTEKRKLVHSKEIFTELWNSSD